MDIIIYIIPLILLLVVFLSIIQSKIDLERIEQFQRAYKIMHETMRDVIILEQLGLKETKKMYLTRHIGAIYNMTFTI